MKTPVLILFVLIGALFAMALAEDIAKPKTVKVRAEVVVSTVLVPDMYLENPNQIDKKQYFKIVERHVVSYEIDKKAYSMTNDFPTGKLIEKNFIRSSEGWIEKPK